MLPLVLRIDAAAVRYTYWRALLALCLLLPWLRGGGDVPMPTRIRHVPPVYPPVAQAAKVQGVVILDAHIRPDGRVGEVHVLRSIPLLDQAAADAVLQWEYTPTLINGQPVPVVMTVTVNFTLRP